MDSIPSSHQDLLADETRSFAYIATLMKDGSPQVTPIWFNTDGQHILVNLAKGRVKDRNMRARPRVAIVIADPRNPYRYVQVRGRVVEITEIAADDHIDSLAYKYHGTPKYDGRTPGMVRVTFKILPERVTTIG
jgi:PPOX class probable F420-dependent enzyme